MYKLLESLIGSYIHVKCHSNKEYKETEGLGGKPIEVIGCLQSVEKDEISLSVDSLQNITSPVGGLEEAVRASAARKGMRLYVSLNLIEEVKQLKSVKPSEMYGEFIGVAGE